MRPCPFPLRPFLPRPFRRRACRRTGCACPHRPSSPQPLHPSPPPPPSRPRRLLPPRPDHRLVRRGPGSCACRSRGPRQRGAPGDPGSHPGGPRTDAPDACCARSGAGRHTGVVVRLRSRIGGARPHPGARVGARSAPASSCSPCSWCSVGSLRAAWSSGSPTSSPPTGTTATAPYAEAIEVASGVEFNDPFSIVAEPTAEFGARLQAQFAAVSPEELAQWRALGLASGAVDDATLASQLASWQGSLYSTIDGQVYHDVAAVGPELDVELTLQVAAASLDQQFGWSIAQGRRTLDAAAATSAEVLRQARALQEASSFTGARPGGFGRTGRRTPTGRRLPPARAARVRRVRRGERRHRRESSRRPRRLGTRTSRAYRPGGGRRPDHARR